MHSELALTLLMAAAALAFPQLDFRSPQEPQFARIVTLQNDADTSGAFSYSYETENGIKAEARGTLNNAGVPDAEEQVVTGSFSFVADNGQVFSVTYIADANGFRAYGDHLPPSPITTEPKPRSSASPKAQIASQAPASVAASPPQSVASPPPTRTEQDDLAQWQSGSDIRGLTPPPPPLVSDDPYSPGLVIIPSERNARQRQRNYYEAIN